MRSNKEALALRKLGLVLAVLLLAGCQSASRGHESATVVERGYTPSATGTGIGTGTCSGANGSGMCTGVVTVFQPESWWVIVRAADGEVWALDVEPEEWVTYEPGETVAFSD